MPPPRAKKHLDAIADALFKAFWRGLARHYGAREGDKIPTHRQLAHAVGCNPFTIQSILAKKPIDHRITTLLPIAAWIGEPLEEILGLTGGRPDGHSRPPEQSTRGTRSALYA